LALIEVLMSDKQAPKVKLDWSRLLGFDQAAPSDGQSAALQIADPRLARVGAKFGGKTGVRTPV
jgi:hypothetical protein